MKKQIEELRNYFLNKVTSCDFQVKSIASDVSNFIDLVVIVDGEHEISISVYPASIGRCFVYSAPVMFHIADDRTKNIYQVIEKEKAKMAAQKVARIEAELEKAKKELSIS